MRGLVAAAMQTSLFESRSRIVRASLFPSVASLIFSDTDIFMMRWVTLSFFSSSSGTGPGAPAPSGGSCAAKRSASQSSTCPLIDSARSATLQILSGSPSAVFVAVSRTPASASNESTYRSVERSTGATAGTSPFAPIIRSAAGAFPSACFCSGFGSTSSGSGQSGMSAPAVLGRGGRGPERHGRELVGRRVPELPAVAQPAEEAVQRVRAREERQDRIAPAAHRVARGAETGVVRPQLEPARDRAHRPIALVEREVKPGGVEEEVGVRAGEPQRLLREDEAEVRVLLHEHEGEPVPGHANGIARRPPVRPLERRVRRREVARRERRRPLLARRARRRVAG